MTARNSIVKIRARIRRSLRRGRMPIEIARKFGLPLLLIAEVVALEATVQPNGGK